MKKLSRALRRAWRIGRGPVQRRRIDPIREEAGRLVSTVLASKSVSEALAPDVPTRPVRKEAVGRLMKNRSFTEAAEKIVGARQRALETRRRILEAALARRRRVRIIVSLLAAGVGVLLLYSKLSASISLGALTVFFFTMAMLVYLQISQAAQFESEARRSQQLAEADEHEERRQLLSDVVVPEVFSTINRLQGVAFKPRLQPFATDGLEDLFDPEYEVSVEATEALQDALGRLRAGSLGIAGSRGAGKTTLIRAACDGRLELAASSLGVMVSAPVRYEAREFIPHVFGEVCLKVRDDDASLGRYEEASGQFQRAGRALLATTGFLVSVYLYLYARLSASASAVRLITLLVVFGAAVLLLVRLVNLFAGGGSNRHLTPIQAEADHHLQQLRYLETRSHELSGELSARAAKLGAKSGRSLAALPLTLPELTSLYRQFVGKVTVDRPLIVGIDELDKMASPKEVRSFLNDIKSLFGQGNTYYLVSVSEQAMSAFERRGLPIRDVFDSVFDDVLHIGQLDLPESEILLQRRVIGMGHPFAALCHTLAGGLPRELIRCARNAVIAAEEANELSAVASSMMRRRVEAQEHAVAVAMWPKIDRDGRQPVLRWLSRQPKLDQYESPESLIAALLDRCDVEKVLLELGATSLSGGAGQDETDVGPRLAIIQLATSWYHAATLLKFFVKVAEGEFEEDREWTPAEKRQLELLCRAQQELSTSVELAWSTVSEFREMLELAPVLAFPGQSGRAPDQELEPEPA